MFTHSNFAVNAPIIRMVSSSSCIVAVTVFWCSLIESNHVLILAVSPLSITQDCILLWNNHFKWVQMKQVYHTIIPPDPPILVHTKVSVYLTGFRNAQFRSVTLRKSICWNLAPEEKIILYPPAKGDGFLLFLKEFFWETDLWVTLGDCTVKNAKLGWEICIYWKSIE